MTNTDIYQDIAARTGGSLFVGVLGPVRTGKSTFIKRFMETCVIPNIDNIYRRERAIDELPQSGSLPSSRSWESPSWFFLIPPSPTATGR